MKCDEFMEKRHREGTENQGEKTKPASQPNKNKNKLFFLTDFEMGLRVLMQNYFLFSL